MNDDLSEFVVVYVTAPSLDVARSLASELVNSRVAACTKIFPDVCSIYRWEGMVEESVEHQLVIKTRRKCFEQVCGVIKVVHPYEVPEIVAVPVVAGFGPYLEWIRNVTSSE